MREAKFFVLVLLFMLAFSYPATATEVVDSSAKRAVENTLKAELVLDNIYNRKSVRKYIPNKAISKEDTEKLLRAGMAAPSGRNKQPWELIVIDDREVLNKLSEALPYAKMLKQAPMAIVVCGDTNKSTFWYLDCSAVTQNILLAAEALDLGAVWTAAYPSEELINSIQKVLGIPKNVVPLNLIPLGHPQGEFKAQDKWDENKVHKNKW